MVALRSSTPEFVGDDRRSWANSLSITGRSLAMVAGFASAGVVVSLVGYTAAFMVDLITFVVCAVTVALLPIPGGGRGTPGGGRGKDARPGSEGGSGRGTREKGRPGRRPRHPLPPPPAPASIPAGRSDEDSRTTLFSQS